MGVATFSMSRFRFPLPSLLTGVAANICVLFTANDAYMRHMRIYVPEDCVASNTPRENRYALAQMETVLKAVTTASAGLALSKIAKEG